MTREEAVRRIDQAAEEKLTELDLSGLKLEELPPEIGKCTQLETLVLGKVESWMCSNSGTTTLKLIINQLRTLPEELRSLLNLRSIDLSGNRFGKMPELLLEMKQLESLNLVSIGLTEIPDAIGQLSNLTELNLSNNQITSIPEFIGKLSNLTQLDLSNNHITSIPEVIGKLSNLTQLDLSGTLITSIPEVIGKLSNLTQLDLSRNLITSIPEFIGKLSKLTELNLSNNQITSIPEVIGQLSKLTELNLSNNQITSIPEVIGKLSKLTELGLSNNQITSIPEVIGKLSNLTELGLSNNQITSIPEFIGKLSNLTELNLSNNLITSIPEVIGQLSKLTELNLSNNLITSIPDAIGQLSKLTELNLSNNLITSIPEVIGKLSNLTQLDLSDNQIASIPQAIGQLSNLTQLYLRNNQITVIPEAIRSMEKLEKLDLRGNPMPIPPEILGPNEYYEDPGDLRTILDFYFQTRDPNDTEELNEAKLLIVGEGEAGKTTLAKKLLNPDYELEKQEPSTKGIDVMRWEFTQPNGKPFRIHLWDFGGQAIYHHTHQFFLTERSLYILLVDNRRENPNLCYWLNIIELLSKSSPVFLVQNEKQDRRCEIKVRQLRGDFDNLEKDFATNLADNRGLETLQRALQNRISNLDHISTPIPKRWANVRHVLENYSQSQTRIDVSEFYEICVSQGFKKSEKRAMLSLSKYLHDLGIILHFQEDSHLDQQVILRPEWATNAVYKVTDNDGVKANWGYFTQENLSEIWRDDEYEDLHGKLLELMKKFKICYEISDKSGQYIAPQLLSSEPPDYEWDDTDNLILRYEYDFMPKGIITRLIVEMHRLIDRSNSSGFAENKPGIVWRDGVVLTDGYGKAEVIEDYEKREIRIRVSGKLKQSILDITRHKLSEIHHKLFDDRLKYKELIPCNCPKCKGDKSPCTYPFNTLQDFYSDRQQNIQCQKSYQMVNVRGLIADFPDYSQQREKDQDRASGIERPDRVDSSSFQPTINIHNTMTQDSPKNQFNAPVSGVVANEKAEVTNSTFIQTNNANTAELRSVE
ncbi:leucine-rich repeat domain-containing protein [Microcoleus sp. T2B6]|uniref:leucine-rich repeat domain-containing protein n=1 Tax=Microcoleus sp. T2B6 TaxID=3055424 RepID=UPI002FD3FE10